MYVLVNGYVEHGHKLDKQWKTGILPLFFNGLQMSCRNAKFFG